MAEESTTTIRVSNAAAFADLFLQYFPLEVCRRPPGRDGNCSRNIVTFIRHSRRSLDDGTGGLQ